MRATLSISMLFFLFSCSELKQDGVASGEEAIEMSQDAAVTLHQKKVEVACATCIYKMSGVTGCKLAAMIEGNPVLVTGGDVNAHASGLCSTKKPAIVSGSMDGKTFAATEVELR